MTIDKPPLEINNFTLVSIKDDFYDAVDNVSLTLERMKFWPWLGNQDVEIYISDNHHGITQQNNTKITGDIIYVGM